MTFIDTSGILAALNADDEFHRKAKETWSELVNNDETVVTTNYIVIETMAVLQARIGIEAVYTVHDDIIPLLNIHWIDESVHNAAMSALLTASRRQLSFVDCVSFETMRQNGINRAFTFDGHFIEQGFQCIPG